MGEVIKLKRIIPAIVVTSSPAWYCTRCNDSHHILYINGSETYCEKCVPDFIKDNATYMNANREPIEIKDGD